MSWQDTIQSPLVIKTGDGKEFTPFWRNTCAKEIEYNIAQFDFPKIQGSKIDRGTPMARKFSLEICFQGDDHLNEALSFEISARDPRPWTISHPIYGNILVQPVSLKFDYSGFNVTQISGSILETLGSAGLLITVVPEDKIVADKTALDETITQSYSSEMELLRARELTPSDITTRDLAFSTRQVAKLSSINSTLYDIGSKSVELTEDAGKYLNVFNSANAAISQGISQASEIMASLQAVINFPSQMVTTVVVRSSVIQSQFDALRENLTGITKSADKKNYESVGCTLVSSMAVSSISNVSYTTKQDVLSQIGKIQTLRNQFLADLDSIQSDNGGSESSYIPDADSITKMDDLINFTIANLATIALSAKQERIVILEADSNPIILAHRFYGLLADDSTIQQFIDTNEIFLNELLFIRKGRTLKFYI